MARSRLLEDVRLSIRRKHYSHRTEQSYVYWIRFFIRFHKLRHPGDMREDEVRQFLDYLAIGRKVSASTQNQALAAILYLYREVLGSPLEMIKGVERARQTKYLPVVLICPMHCIENTRMQIANGAGSLFFRLQRFPQTVKSTQIYTHVLNRGGRGVRSPLDGRYNPYFNMYR